MWWKFLDSFLVGKRELVSEGMQELHYGRLCSVQIWRKGKVCEKLFWGTLC